MTKKYLITVSLYFSAITACMSGSNEKMDSLDIVQNSDSSEITSTLDWRTFFQELPTPSQRRQILESLKVKPSNMNTTELISFGRKLYALGSLNEAESYFSEALRRQPQNSHALLEMSQIYIKKGDLKTALELLAEAKETIMKSETNDRSLILKFRYLVSKAYLQNGQIIKAQNIITDLLKIDKTFRPAYILLASSYLERGKLEIAQFVLKQGQDRCGDHPSFLNLHGVIAEKKGLADEGVRWFEKSLQMDPSFVPAIVNLAYNSLKMRDYLLAETRLKNAVEINPGNADAWIALGETLTNSGKFADAEAAYLKGLDLNPEHAIGRVKLGLLYAENLKLPHKALRLFNEVMQIPNIAPTTR